MIRRLRGKMVVVTMGTLLALFALVFLVLNVYMNVRSTRQVDGLLRFVAEQESVLPDMPHMPGLEGGPQGDMPPEGMPDGPDNSDMFRAMRLFFATMDASGKMLTLNTGRMPDMDAETLSGYVQGAMARGVGAGTLGSLRYLVQEKPYGYIVVLAERSIENHMLMELTRISLWTLLGGILLLLGPVILLSGWMVRPVQQTFQKQRQFVSDASHELKTPLTIISANADVLQNEIGENRWVRSIQEQSARMGALVHDLLSLARADEKANQRLHVAFDASRAVRNASLAFESRVFEEGKRFSEDIEAGLRMVGDEAGIKQLVSILMDNAIIHSDAGGEIRLSLQRKNGMMMLSVYNTGAGVPEAEREKLFERFYRSDASRSRGSGGYGLGLAIARMIVTEHRGRIFVESEPGKWTRFVVALPKKET